MKRLSTLLPWMASAAVALLATVNWTTLTAPAPLNLLVTQVQVPLGVVLLGTTAVLVVLFGVAHLRNQVGSLLETRRLLREAQRAHERADEAEASRIRGLSDQIDKEFRLLDRRLGPTPDARAAGVAAPQAAPVDAGFRPMSLTDIVTGHPH